MNLAGPERTIVSQPDTDEEAAWFGQIGQLMAASAEAEARGLNFVLLENEWEGLGDGTGRWVSSYRLEEGAGMLERSAFGRIADESAWARKEIAHVRAELAEWITRADNAEAELNDLRRDFNRLAEENAAKDELLQRLAFGSLGGEALRDLVLDAKAALDREEGSGDA